LIQIAKCLAALGLAFVTPACGNSETVTQVLPKQAAVSAAQDIWRPARRIEGGVSAFALEANEDAPVDQLSGR